MEMIYLKSAAEQVAAHLRQQAIEGQLTGLLPGVKHLATGLGVNHKTVEAALLLLEKEGILEIQGAGRRRRIALPHDEGVPKRVGFMLYDAASAQLDYMINLRHTLQEAGHVLVIPDKALVDLKMDVKRVAGMVRSTSADAWVISAGSRAVLEWFAAQPEPSFALFGRQQGIRVAGVKPNKPGAYTAAVHRLVELGHRSIVMLCRTESRLPEPGRGPRAFLDALEARSVQTGRYNLPDWDDTPQGFQAVLESLFRVTPPTALLVDEAFLFAATQQFLARRGIRVPEDVSLICTDADPTFAWCRPTIAHIDWDSRPVVRRVARWAAAISRGREDLKQTLTEATFADGGTVGPAK
jgi:DNA-binding LacI/PurR family transcriptional regulator